MPQSSYTGRCAKPKYHVIFFLFPVSFSIRTSQVLGMVSRNHGVVSGKRAALATRASASETFTYYFLTSHAQRKCHVETALPYVQRTSTSYHPNAIRSALIPSRRHHPRLLPRCIA